MKVFLMMIVRFHIVGRPLNVLPDGEFIEIGCVDLTNSPLATVDVSRKNATLQRAGRNEGVGENWSSLRAD